jgi:aspartate/methionine/tyrosine aminotransferase
MRIDLFRMERTQSLYENEVEFNLSESGVLPMQIQEILDGPEGPSSLHSLRLKYPPAAGSNLLRERIGLFYGDARLENVLVTNGGSEANYVCLWGLLDKSDHAAIMIPNYLQTWGLARAYAGRARPFRLVERHEEGRARWALDVDSLERAVTRKTRLILVTHPNNPTGAVLNEEEMDAVVRVARRSGAFIVSDEVYRGAEVYRPGERPGPPSPTFWGRYDRVLITAGVSKAFGLPGLRTGWIVGPAKTVSKLCSYHDYLTLTPTYLSNRLAEAAMEPVKREAILARTRDIIRRNLPRLEEWIRSHGDLFDYIPPVAGAIATIRYDLPIGSVALFDRLRRERSVLITPGGHFGIGKYIRIGYGYDIELTLRGLARVDETIAALRRASPARRAPRRSAAAARRARRGLPRATA